jgi:uncharacterized protein
MDRSSPLSFECACCGKCCSNKRITLFPYEIARIAAACGKTTGEVLACHTDEGGTVLLMDPQHGRCTFLQDGKCGIHSGRPLACRLYPLGRHSGPAGEDYFLTPLHAFCSARRDRETTTGEFLDSQEIAPYVSAADRYGILLKQMVLVLKKSDNALQALTETLGSQHDIASPWLDVDGTTQAYCDKTGIRMPASVEEKISLHLKALTEWVAVSI